MRTRRVKALAVVVSAAAFLAHAPAAHAHPEMSPLQTNRYLTVAVFPRQLTLSYALLHGALPGGEERRRLDADHDGAISETEATNEKTRLLADAASLFTFTLDGAAPRLDLRVTIDLGPDARATAAPLMVELGASMTLAPGGHRVRVEPGREPARLGETEIALDAAPGVAITEAFSGERARGEPVKGTRFKYQGPRVAALEDRSATFAFTLPATAAPPATTARSSPSATLAVFAVGAVLLAAVATLALRRRQRAQRR